VKSIFTTKERKVILFLSVLFLLGNGIRLYRRIAAPDDDTILDLGSLEPADSAEGAKLLQSSIELKRQHEIVEEVSFPIDINRADRHQLEALPGIGTVLAGRIMTYRDSHGPFRSLEELTDVKGIGTNRLKELEPFLAIDQN